MRIFIYKISKNFFLTEDMVRHIEGRMAILYPATRKIVRQKVGEQLLMCHIRTAIFTICLDIVYVDVRDEYPVFLESILQRVLIDCGYAVNVTGIKG